MNKLITVSGKEIENGGDARPATGIRGEWEKVCGFLVPRGDQTSMRKLASKQGGP